MKIGLIIRKLTLVKKISSEKFPVLQNHKITKNDGAIILEVEKKFDINLDDMPWKPQPFNQG